MDQGTIFEGYGISVSDGALTEKFVRAQGPGGQNVNKVATAVELRLSLEKAALPAQVQERLVKLAGQRATKDGEIIIFADTYRTQERNREEARQRMADLIGKAATPPPPPRRKTKPTKASIERRLKEKTGRSGIKKMRGRVQDD